MRRWRLTAPLTMIDNGHFDLAVQLLTMARNPARGGALLDRAESDAPARRPQCWAGLMWRSICAFFYRSSGHHD